MSYNPANPPKPEKPSLTENFKRNMEKIKRRRIARRSAQEKK